MPNASGFVHRRTKNIRSKFHLAAGPFLEMEFFQKRWSVPCACGALGQRRSPEGWFGFQKDEEWFNIGHQRAFCRPQAAWKRRAIPKSAETGSKATNGYHSESKKRIFFLFRHKTRIFARKTNNLPPLFLISLHHLHRPLTKLVYN
ncbi:MAG: hypothetical protein ACOX6U_09500 [Oscillospiraceae bacterium]